MCRNLLFVVLMSGAAASLGAQETGQTLAEVEAKWGPPTSRSESATRGVYRWPEFELATEHGRVVRVARRDLEAEANAEERRIQNREAELQARAEADRIEAQRMEERAAHETRERLERERREQVERMAAVERERDEELARLRAETKAAENAQALERNARLNSLNKDLSALRLEVERAELGDDAERVKRLRAALRAKAAEFTLLQQSAR